MPVAPEAPVASVHSLVDQVKALLDTLVLSHEACIQPGSEAPELKTPDSQEAQVPADESSSGVNSMQVGWHQSEPASNLRASPSLESILTVQRFVRGWLVRHDPTRFRSGDEIRTRRSGASGRFRDANVVISNFVDQAEEFHEAVVEQIDSAGFVLHNSWLLSDDAMAVIKGRSFGYMVMARKSQHTTASSIMPRKSSCAMNPAFPLRQMWDIMSLMLVLVDLVLVPFSVFQSERIEELVVMEVSAAVFWTLDIVVSFFTAVYVDGELHTDLRFIGRHYLTGWFLFDLTLTVSDWVDASRALQSQWIDSMDVIRIQRLRRWRRLLRGMQFLRSIAFKKLRDHLRQHQQVLRSSFSMAFLAAANMFVIHALACLWYAAGDSTFGWVQITGIKESALDERYWASLEWTLSRLHPSNMKENMQLGSSWEKAMAVFATFTALLLGSVFVSEVTNNMSDLRRIHRHNQQAKETVLDYAAAYSASDELMVKLRKFLRRNAWSSQVPKRSELVKLLPVHLYRELVLEAQAPKIRCHELFKQLAEKYPSLTISLCQDALLEWNALLDESFFVPGDSCNHMFFVAMGEVMYEPGIVTRSSHLSTTRRKKARFRKKKPTNSSSKSSLSSGRSVVPSDTVDATSAEASEWLVPGDWMCEPALWTVWQNCGEAVAGPNTTVLQMSQEDFSCIIGRQGQAILDVVAYARCFVLGLNEMTPNLSDLPMNLVDGKLKQVRHPSSFRPGKV